MAISFVGAASAEASSVALPTHQAGDLIIICGANDSGPVGIPSNFEFVWQYNVLAGRRHTLGYKIAQSSGETSGEWTNAKILLCVVYRHANNYLIVGNNNNVQSSGSTVSYLGTTARNFGWIVGFGQCASKSLNIEDPPSGMVNRITLEHSVTNLGASFHDTDGDSTWSTQTITLSAATGWATSVFDLHDTGIVKSAGGGVRIPNIRGGADQ